MLAEIIPAARLPRKLTSFSYLVPQKLQAQVKIGQIVEIYLRNKKIQGLVINVEKNRQKTKYQLKEINKTLFPVSLVNKNQIKLINFISDYYGVGQGIIVKSLLPEVPKRQLTTNNYQPTTIKKQKQAQQPKLFWYNFEDETITLLRKKIKNNGGQTLILVPEKILIYKLIEKLKLPEKTTIINHAEVAKVKNFENWLEILSGQHKIIIGTKISVFLPFNNLSEIIIWDEQDWNHKQSDINPRFDARWVAAWLAKQHGCRLTQLTPAPSMETYYNNPKRKRIKKLKNNDIKIVNLKEERLKGNYSFLSDELVENIKDKLSAKEKIFIFHNRKGLANYVSCADCGYVFKCPNCEIVLVYHADDKLLHCHHCNYKSEITPLCPQCQSGNLSFKGQGVDKIKSELQQIFAQTKILILEKQTDKIDLLNEIKKYDIIISTEFTINKIGFNNFGLLVFLNFDQLVNQADFRVQERALQLFYKIKSTSSSRAEFIIQTNQPENTIIKAIRQNQPENFYNLELENRKNFNYPPYTKIIKLVCQNKAQELAKKESQKLTDILKNTFDSKIEVNGPIEGFPKKIRGNYRYSLILKIDSTLDTKKLFKLIPDDFIIDVDPENMN